MRARPRAGQRAEREIEERPRQLDVDHGQTMLALCRALMRGAQRTNARLAQSPITVLAVVLAFMGTALGLDNPALATPPPCSGTTCTVATASDLQAAINTINANPSTSYTVNVTGGTIQLNSSTTLSAIMTSSTVTINGNGNMLDGGSAGGTTNSNATHGFFVYSGTVQINNLTIQNTVAQGGGGGASPSGNGGGGGGGLGAGGAVFVNAGASVTLNSVSFASNNATGGAGGNSAGQTGLASGGGGGGGLFGSGAAGGTDGPGGGGGGAFGNGGAAATPSGGGGGGGGFAGNGGAGGGSGTGGDGDGGGGGGGLTGAGGAGTVPGGGTGGDGGAGGAPNGGSPGTGSASGDAGSGGTGGTGGGGGGGGGTTAINAGGMGGNGGPFGGGGGGGTGVGSDGAGGNGGVGGGGGGAASGGQSGAAGGSGGDFGGGGGGAQGLGVAGGNGGGGGFGAGGGGIGSSALTGGKGGLAGFGGGNGGSKATGGDGGSAFGGAVFVRPGGSLTIEDSSFASSNTTAAGLGGAGGVSGTAGANGAAAGGALYLNGVTATYSVSSGSQSVASDIAGTGGITKTGVGTLALSAANSYTGGTTLSQGTLTVGNSSALGTNSLSMAAGTTLAFTGGNFALANNISISGDPNFAPGAGTTQTINGVISDGTSPGVVNMQGPGTLMLTNFNTYTGATNITGGTLALSSGGAIATSSVVNVGSGATFDVSNNVGTSLIQTLSGGGAVQLGGNNLAILNGSTEFSGGIAGTGGIEIGAGTQTFSGANTYSNLTQIDAGATLALKGAGSVANSVMNFAPPFFGGGAPILDISQTNGRASVGGLDDFFGVGVVNLGSQTLTITSNFGAPFLGVIQDGGIAGGTGGGITLASGAYQILGGINTYTGATTIQAGATLELDSPGSIATSSGVNLTGTRATFDISGASNPTIKDLAGVTGSVVALGGNALTLGTANSTIFAGVLQDGGNSGGFGGALIKQGSGALTLSGANSYTGGTTLSQGTLVVGNNSALGTGALSMAAGTTLGFAGGNFTIGNNIVINGDPNFAPSSGTTQTLTGIISDGATPGVVNMLGPGSLVLSGANTYSGGTQLSGGVLQAAAATVGSPGAITSSAIGTGTLIFAGGTLQAGLNNLTIANNAVINTTGGTIDANGDNLTFSGVIGNGNGTTGGLTITSSVAGAGTVNLTSANTYSGGTTVTGGTLQLSGSGTLGANTGSLTILGGTVDLGGKTQTQNGGFAISAGTLQDGTLSSSRAFALTGGTVNAMLTSGGILTMSGTGTAILSGANTYTGGTNVSGGTLRLSGAGTLGANAGLLTLTGGTVDLGGTTQTQNGGLALSGGTLQNGTLSSSNTFFLTGGTVSANLTGSGLLQVSSGGPSSTVVLSGSNSYTGGTNISGGTLQLGSLAALPSSTALTIAGGALDLHGFLTSVGSLSGAGSVTNNSTAAAALGVGGTNSVTTFSGVIQDGTGTVLLGVNGPGALTLTGANTYSGGTQVGGGGILQLSGSGTLGANTGSLTLLGGTVDLGGTTQTQNGGLILSSGTLQNGTLSSTGTFALTGGTITASLTGSGGLTKSGSGTATLSGSDTYTGVTTVSGGTLALSGAGSIAKSSGLSLSSGTTFDISGSTGLDAINNLTGAGGSAVNLGGNTLAVNLTGSSTFGGSFVGNNSSQVFLQGSGTEVLTGASATSGSFFINSGKLAIGAGGSLPSAVGGVFVNGGGAVFDISNGGNQTILNLSGIGAGSVALGANTLTLINTRPNVLPAIISGTGGLVVDAPSSLTLSGANTYTGSTTVAGGGTLLIGAGGSIAASSGLSVGAGATFDLIGAGGGNQTIKDLSGTTGSQIILGPFNLTVGTANSTEFDGVISGNTPINGLIKQGAGTLTLGRASTYIGPTTINAGTLALGAFGSLAASSEINLAAAGAAFDISRIAPSSGPTVIQDLVGVAGTTVSLGTSGLALGTADSTNFAGSFTGTGQLTKQGSGTLTLDGNSSGFAGSTTVAAGTLEVGDINNPGTALGGSVTVDAGGTLAGHGSILGNVINLAGTVSPGGTIGTLSIGGNYTQGSNATLSIEVSPTAASQLKVGGAASLAGKLALLFDPGVYTPTSYKLITASSVSGAFSTVSGSNPSGLSQMLIIDPADVTLQLGVANPTTPVTPVTPVVVAPTNDTIFTAVTSTAILTAQQANGIILDRIGNRAAGVADGQIAAVPSSVALPEQYAQAGNAAALGDLASALPQSLASQGAWFRGIGGFASINGSASAPGFIGETGGFLAGYDRPVAPNAYMGIAGGYLHSNIDEHSTSSGTESSARIAAYGGLSFGANLFTATAGYAHDTFETARGFSSVGTANASHGGNEATAAAQWSLPLQIQGYGGIAMLTPKAGLQFVHLSENALTETGASGFDLGVGGRGTDSVQPYIGAALAQRFVTDSGAEITPELRLGYVYEAESNARLLTVTTVGGVNFPVIGVKPSRDQLTGGLGLSMVAGPDLSVYATYDAVLPTGNTTEQTIQAGLRWRF